MQQTKRPLRGLSPKSLPDFLEAYPRGLKATRRCGQCHRDFFGETCYEAHCTRDHSGKPATSPQTTVCFRRRRCRDCFKQEVGPQALKRHQCGYLDCPSCHEYVDGETHRCFIQRVPTPQEQKKKKKRKRQGGWRSSCQTRGGRGASHLASQRHGGGGRRRGRRHATPARVF